MRILMLLLVPALVLAGCTGPAPDDQGDDGIEAPEGPHGLPETVTGFEHLAQVDAGAAQGIWVHEGIAYLSGPSGLRIVDVRDPAAPVVLAEDVPDTESSRDVDLIFHPSGRVFAVLSHDSSYLSLVDVTDPERPETVGRAEGLGNTHNNAVVPNSTIVYSSRSTSLHVPGLGTTGIVDMVDFADPLDPEVTRFHFPAVAMTVGGVPKPVTATTCHDITFNVERQLAYCAGVTETHVWDISDPKAPQIIQVIAWPGTNIHHAVWGVRGGDLLILGDEFAGVLAPTPMCHEEALYPTSALWFVDVSDLAAPVPMGYFQASWDAAGASLDAGQPIYCSTHFGTPVEDRDLFVIGWYSAGTVLVDFSDPAAPQQVDHFRPEGAVNTWEARYHDGHVYTGDGARGMDILRLV